MMSVMCPRSQTTTTTTTGTSRPYRLPMARIIFLCIHRTSEVIHIYYHKILGLFERTKNADRTWIRVNRVWSIRFRTKKLKPSHMGNGTAEVFWCCVRRLTLQTSAWSKCQVFFRTAAHSSPQSKRRWLHLTSSFQFFRSLISLGPLLVSFAFLNHWHIVVWKITPANRRRPLIRTCQQFWQNVLWYERGMRGVCHFYPRLNTPSSDLRRNRRSIS